MLRLMLRLSSIIKKVTLLDGICAEAAELLKDQHFAAEMGRILRKMKPTRQVECVELMLSANNVSLNYASAMLMATPAAMLVDAGKTTNRRGLTQEQLAKMEREMSNVQGQYKMVEQTYGQDVLNLVLVKGCFLEVVAQARVMRLEDIDDKLLSDFPYNNEVREHRANVTTSLIGDFQRPWLAI